MLDARPRFQYIVLRTAKRNSKHSQRTDTGDSNGNFLLQAKKNRLKEIRRQKGGTTQNESQSQPRNFVPQKSAKQKMNVFAEFCRNVRFCFTEICRTKIEPFTEFCRTLKFWTFTEFCRSPRLVRILTTRRTVRNKGGSVLPKTGRNPIKGYTDKPL